jgi:NADH:ubiquinone reductase (non-electrogenic)
MSLVKALDASTAAKYDVVVLSPRNYFLYTPLLPAVAAGTCEERSIVEPVRNLVAPKGVSFYEAVCTSVDPQRRELVACFPKDAGLDEACFKMSYDLLVVGVGSVNNTFGIKGVEDHCVYFKTIDDALRLRRRVSECFERAALPATPLEERRRLLSFVVVGGGPTGVEVAAELYDMIHEDLSRLYPSLMADVKLRVVELTDHLLSTYDRKISAYAAENFKRAGIESLLNSRVAAVSDGSVTIVGPDKTEREVGFGACVWATGIAMNPLVKQLQAQLPGQTHFRSLLTDDKLCVKGAPGGSIWAFGDAATIDQPRALERAEELFVAGDTNGDGRLSLRELRDLLRGASSEFSHFEEHAQFLDSRANAWGGLVKKAVAAANNGGGGGGGAATATAEDVLSTLQDDEDSLSKEEFRDLLGKVDMGLRALPATAQVAKQQGEYLARALKEGLAELEATSGGGSAAAAPLPPTSVTPLPADRPQYTWNLPESLGPFRYFHKGSLAYVGSDRAVMDVPKVGPIVGAGAYVMWRSYETFAQISVRNQLLVGLDWVRTKLFGRDISRF